MIPSANAFAVGLLLFRIALGPTLFFHGYQKAFKGGKLKGTAGWFESIGLRPGKLHAPLAAGTEMGAGALVALGLLTPLGCAGFVGLMAVAGITSHRGKGFFVFKDGWEYVGVLGLLAVALAVLGPGRFSLDRALGIDRCGIGWGAAAAVVGLAGAGLLLVTTWRPPPPPPPKKG